MILIESLVSLVATLGVTGWCINFSRHLEVCNHNYPHDTGCHVTQLIDQTTISIKHDHSLL